MRWRSAASGSAPRAAAMFSRTWATLVVAGIAQMSYPRFAAYNVFGGIFWVCSMTGAGYYLGTVFWIRHNLEKVILLIVLISIMPIVIEYFRSRSKVKRSLQQ
jgi:membrane-associated protein